MLSLSRNGSYSLPLSMKQRSVHLEYIKSDVCFNEGKVCDVCTVSERFFLSFDNCNFLSSSSTDRTLKILKELIYFKVEVLKNYHPPFNLDKYLLMSMITKTLTFNKSPPLLVNSALHFSMAMSVFRV